MATAAELGQYTLDGRALCNAFEARCKQFNVPIGYVLNLLGINWAQYSRLRRRITHDIHSRFMLRMCAWAQLNPLEYLHGQVTVGSTYCAGCNSRQRKESV